MVYVDSLVNAISNNPQAYRAGARSGHQWCHLWADSEKELVAFAETLGLKREWIQHKKIKVFAVGGSRIVDLTHFDLVPSRRQKAIDLGAKQVNIREFIRDKIQKSDVIIVL
jgi:hypothetical protein